MNTIKSISTGLMTWTALAFSFAHAITQPAFTAPSILPEASSTDTPQQQEEKVDFFKLAKQYAGSNTASNSAVGTSSLDTVNMSPYEKMQYYNSQQNAEGVTKSNQQNYLNNLERAKERGTISKEQYYQKINEVPLSKPNNNEPKLSFPITIGD